MKFDQRGWVTEIAAGTVAAIVAASIGALLVPDASIGAAVAVGGAIGFVRAALNLPLKWLLDRRPPTDVSLANREDGEEESLT